MKRLCAEADLAEGRALRFELIVADRRSEGFVARFQGRLIAYQNVCRHVPLPLDYGDGEFFTRDGRHLLCRNHGAMYEPLTGLCVRGPCIGESLLPLPIEVRDGVIWLREDGA